MSIFIKNKHSFKWPFIIFSAIFFITVFSVATIYFIFEDRYKERIYPHTYLGNTELSGLTMNDARKKINNITDNFRHQGFDFAYHEKKATLYPLISSLESDSAYEIVTFNV